MLRLVLNEDHLAGVLGEVLSRCRHRLLIATADVKDVHVPAAIRRSAPSGRGRAESIFAIFRELSGRCVNVRLLHGGVPSGAFLAELRGGLPANFTMRRCPRVHVKAIIADGRLMYLGSANLTGAGLGAKSPRRRNFEAGVWTDDVRLIDPAADMLEAIWDGSRCGDCGRKPYCPVPLEEPDL